MFQGKFRKNFGPNDRIFPKFFHNIEHFSKNFLKILTKMNIGEHSICKIENIFFGGKEVAQEGGEIFTNVYPKL